MRNVIISGKNVTNKSFIVDDEDFEETSKFKWYGVGRNNRYVARFENKKTVYLHREIVKNYIGSIELGLFIDHINGDTLDNRRSNLRLCTAAQNQANKRMQINNTSGYKGVKWSKEKKRWIAYISNKNKQEYIGMFGLIHDAAKAYNERAVSLFGEFALVNRIKDPSHGGKA